LERIGLSGYFKSVIDGNKTAKAKPDPEVFVMAANELGAKPESCIVFEDAEAGIEAALAGGMHTVGVGSPRILGKAEMVISGFAEINLNRILTFFEKKL
jgi:beta-phosphoglucomutase